MSRRHKNQEKENPSTKTTTAFIDLERFSFLVDLIRYSESKIHNVIGKVFESCAKLWTNIISDVGVIDRLCILYERKHEENMLNTLAMMDIEIKHENPQSIADDIQQKKIDRILHIDKKEDNKPKQIGRAHV